MQDEYGNVFLLMPGVELVTYSKERNNFSGKNNFIPIKPGWAINDIIQQPGTQKYWMCIENVGIVVYNKATNNLSYAGNNKENEPAVEQLKKIPFPYRLFIDSKGRLWVSEKRGESAYIHGFDLKKQQLFLPDYPMASNKKSNFLVDLFAEQKDGTIWMTGVNVLARYLEAENKFEHAYNGYVDDRSIDFVTIGCLMEDREGNLWAGTLNNGLFRFNPATEFFTNTRHINPETGNSSDRPPISFVQLKNGNILVGIMMEQMLEYDVNLKQIPLEIKELNNAKSKTLGAMYASGDSNTIWMAAPNGIYQYKQNEKQLSFLSTAFVNSRMRELAEDKNGNVWAGYENDGLYKYNIGSNKSFPESFYKITAVKGTRINKITIDKKGLVWVATFPEGVYVLDPVTEKVILHFSNKEKENFYLPEPAAISVLECNDSIMLLATSSRIIIYNRIQKKTIFTSSPNQLTGLISSLEMDKHGFIWVATTSGLFRVTTKNKVFVKFNREDGIRNDFFVTSASYKLRDGRILLGSTGTIVSFDPSTVNVNTSYPTIKIADFRLMNESLRVDSLLKLKVIELEPGENSLSIDLTTLSYSTSYGIKYKLEGIDKDWRYTDRSQQLIYSFLPAGDYTLYATTIDGNGNESPLQLALEIKVNPLFYKTWWFYSLMVLVTGTLLFWLDRERMKRKEASQKMRTDIADDLHKEINTALSHINILSEMAKLKADTEPLKSKEFIEQIHTKSHNMIIAMDDLLWNIDPDNDSMGRIVLRLKEYIDSMRNRYGVQIDLLVDKPAASLTLNMKLRKEVYWLFRSGVTTVIRSGGNNLRVYVTYEKPNLVYLLEFDTTQMDIQQLNNLRQREELAAKLKSINARLELQQHTSTGTFTLTIPVA